MGADVCRCMQRNQGTEARWAGRGLCGSTAGQCLSGREVKDREAGEMGGLGRRALMNCSAGRTNI